MSGKVGYHHRGIVIGTRIRSLFHSLGPSTYDEISPKIEYWIEYALTEQSVDADELVEQLSFMAWGGCSSSADVARFLKEFHDAPHCSEQARSIVDKLCEHVLRWFAAASAEVLKVWRWDDANRVAMSRGGEFHMCCVIRWASHRGGLVRSRVRAATSHQTTHNPPLHGSRRYREILQGRGYLPTFRRRRKHVTAGTPRS